MALTIASMALALLLLPVSAYLLVLTLFSAAPRRAPPPARRPVRFAVVVPAHDEAALITETVRGLQSLDHPQSDFRIVVVADNCSDATADLARAAGARVLERRDPQRRGKGFALDHAFRVLLEEGEVDACVVVDADTSASPNLLAAFAARLDQGARAVQARYGVRNLQASWRTRLLALALAMFHDLRSLARERLGLSCGLRGNGMCFAADLLRRHPHHAHGLVEDVEYGIELGLAGIRVAYAHEAHVLGEMAARSGAAAGQRRRWEGGRARLARARLWALLRRAWQTRDRVALDLALDLATPPLSRIALAMLAGAGLEAVALASGGPTPAAWLWGAHALALAGYCGRGLALSGLGLAGLAVLATAPAYLAWRLVALAGGVPAQWRRTERAG